MATLRKRNQQSRLVAGRASGVGMKERPAKAQGPTTLEMEGVARSPGLWTRAMCRAFCSSEARP